MRSESVEIKVRYSEIDGMGRAYNAHYLTWFELGRTDFFRKRGWEYSGIEKDKRLFLPVRETYVKYKRPLFYDDDIVVETSCQLLDSKRIRFSYRLRRDGVLCASGYSVHVFINEQSVMVNIPDFFIEALKK